MKKCIVCENAPKAVGTYSQGIEINGTFYFSGMLGFIPETMELPSDFETQLQQIMFNIDAIITSQNLTKKNIIKTTIFMTDLKMFPKVNQTYQDFFGELEYFPARSCIEVSALPKDALIEIEVIASS